MVLPVGQSTGIALLGIAADGQGRATDNTERVERDHRLAGFHRGGETVGIVDKILALDLINLHFELVVRLVEELDEHVGIGGVGRVSGGDVEVIFAHGVCCERAGRNGGKAQRGGHERVFLVRIVAGLATSRLMVNLDLVEAGRVEGGRGGDCLATDHGFLDHFLVASVRSHAFAAEAAGHEDASWIRGPNRIVTLGGVGPEHVVVERGIVIPDDDKFVVVGGACGGVLVDGDDRTGRVFMVPKGGTDELLTVVNEGIEARVAEEGISGAKACLVFGARDLAADRCVDRRAEAGVPELGCDDLEFDDILGGAAAPCGSDTGEFENGQARVGRGETRVIVHHRCRRGVGYAFVNEILRLGRGWLRNEGHRG